MKSKWLRSALRYSRKAVGFALLLTACGSTAFAGPVPEIDAGSLASAATLLVGGVLMLADRYRRN
jgi:hypothetical protein